MNRFDHRAATSSHFSPNRLTGHLDQARHHGNKGDSGYSSFSTSFIAPDDLSLAHCSKSPGQSGNVFHKAPDSQVLQQTDTNLTSITCDAGAMGTEERPVFPSMENSNNNGHDEYCWPNPPPPPTRRESFLVARQHDGLGSYYDYDGLSPQDATRRLSIETKTEGMTIENNLQSRETINLSLDGLYSDHGQVYFQAPWCRPPLNVTGFVGKYNHSLEGADNFTSKQPAKPPPSNPTGSPPSFIHHSSGVTLDCAESQQQICSLPLAHGTKPPPISQQLLELPPVVTPSSPSESNQKAAPYFYIANTYTHTSTREPRPADGFSGPILARNPEKTIEPQRSEVDSKFHVERGCKEKQESLNEMNARHLIPQSPRLELQPTCGELGFRGHGTISSSQIFYCGPEEKLQKPKPHPTVPESAMQSKYTSQRQMRNSTDSAGFQINPHSAARNSCNGLETDLLRPTRELCANAAITAENTPMLHRLTIESTNMATNTALNTVQKRQLTEGSKEEYRQREGNRDLRRGFRNKIAQLRKSKSSSQLLDESTELNQLNEEPVDVSGSPNDSSKIAYRNQVKHAQTKVLTETSFKRRDLQFSWPNRAKQKATERPSIAHFHTVSLTDPSHFPDDSTTMTQLSQVLQEDVGSKPPASQHHAARIGSRKRLTLQEKKMYHSEPEKINQLGVPNNSRKYTPSCELEKTFNFPNTHGERSFVASRRQLFEMTSAATNSSSVGLKQIQQKALVEYVDRKRGQRLCSTELICDQRQMVNSTQHRRLSEWSHNPYSSVNPAKGQNISRHKSAEILWGPWDNLSASPAVCSNVSLTCKSQHFQEQKAGVTISGTFASTENLLDQPKSVQFVRRPRSKSSPLSSQKDSAPGVSSETRQMDVSNSSSRPITAAISSASVSVSCAKCNEDKHEDLAPSNLQRPRGKSLNELALSLARSPTLLSQSSDQLHCLVTDGEPGSETGNVGSQGRTSEVQAKWNNVALTSKKGPLPLPGLPFPKQNWTKLKREEIKSGTNQVSAATVLERGSNMVKVHAGYLGAESPSPRSPSPHCRLPPPLRKPGDQPNSLSPLSCWEDEVFLEDSCIISENNPPDPYIASENISVQFDLSQQHLSKTFEPSPTETSTNKETKVTTQLISGNNSLTTRESVQINPGGNGKEHHYRYMPSELGSLANCSNTSFEMPGTTSMAQAEKSVEGESENNKLFPVKSHQDNRKELTQQLSTDPGTVSVQRRVKTKSPEDLRMEELMKEIIDEDHSLADVLDPSPRRKTIMDLVEELFQKDTLVLEACQRKQTISPTMEKETKTTDKQDTQFSSSPKGDSQSELPIKINQEKEKAKCEMECPSGASEKKKELINTIKCKLQKLQEAKASLNEDVKMNSTLGEDIEAWVNDVCSPNEIEKYKTFIEDLGKVMNLLLCLSSRLVRVESALTKVNEATDVGEKQSLNERHRTLSRQHEDARGLKEHQDHRERVIFSILTNYLTEEQLQRCRHFVQMKKALLIKQKELEENLKLIEEQLEFLENTLQI
ncbi:protein Shroom1 [Scyliorhinus canicula]|uniref:protein Shroom1 n=1 Tax=Scyliorhinus canicula TaxID=7830 RepID=UPI0018F452CA|nr:protein Shroom1 [Scyliorhinus canicula]